MLIKCSHCSEEDDEDLETLRESMMSLLQNDDGEGRYILLLAFKTITFLTSQTRNLPTFYLACFADEEEEKPAVKKKGKRITAKSKKKKVKVRKVEKDEGGQGDAAE